MNDKFRLFVKLNSDVHCGTCKYSHKNWDDYCMKYHDFFEAPGGILREMADFSEEMGVWPRRICETYEKI